MDIYILRLGEHTAMQYAIGHGKGETYQAFLDSIEEWAANLRAQGYIRVIPVVISFQWSSESFDAPWDRMDTAPPPRRAAGGEIDAVFLAERLTRHFDLHRFIKDSFLRLSGPIALLDARVLGSDVQTRTKATLLGQALTIEHLLDRIEREILDRMDGRMAAQELFTILGELDGPEPAVTAAITSLLRRRLIRLDGEVG